MHLQWTNSITRKKCFSGSNYHVKQRSHLKYHSTVYLQKKNLKKFKIWFTLCIAFYWHVESVFNSSHCLQLKQSSNNIKHLAKVYLKKWNSQSNRIPLPLAYVHFKCLSQTTYNKLVLTYLHLIHYKILILNYEPHCKIPAKLTFMIFLM